MPEALLLWTSTGEAQRGAKYPWLPAASLMWQGAAILFLTLSSDPYNSWGCDSSSLSLHALPALGFQLAIPEV